MPTIELLPSGKTIDVTTGTRLFDATHKAGVDIETPCGGVGTCGRCIVRVVEGDVESDSAGRLPGPALAEGYVLACLSQTTDSPVTVEVPEPTTPQQGQFADAETEQLIRPDLLPAKGDFDPLTSRALLDVPLPQLEDGLSDLDRLTRTLRADHGDVEATLSAVRNAADALRQEDGQVTVTLSHLRRDTQVIEIDPGDTTERHFGVAIDVGTTTVAVQLIDLAERQILGTRSDYNAQVPCGIDVISRINYASTHERLEDIRARVLSTINRLICEVSFSRTVNPREICNAAISGNTVMTHLLLGLPPEQIRHEPYTPTVLRPPPVCGAEVGLGINPSAPVQISPCVGSYVGGDITAGLLCTDLATETNDLHMYIDIGTNGEIVIGSSDFLMGCACSAGPAFEGGGIDCGMRAAVGAIDKVHVDEKTGEPRWSTIGGAAPMGICGSGMIDLVANLFLSGWTDRSGRLDRQRPSPAVVVDGKRARYVIVAEQESGTGAAVSVSEAEIDNIIRAKAAIYSAAALMLDRIDTAFSDLSTIWVAGGFGRFLDLDKAIAIGMLPDVTRQRFRYLGNASLLGSYMVVASRDARRRQLEIADRLTYFELSTEPAYMDKFTGALFLPHTDLTQFPSVASRLDDA
ncbi:ASKHA domain-containing protein [Myxococcota bacterium]